MDAADRTAAYNRRQDVYKKHLLPFYQSTPSFLGKFSFGKDFHAVRQERLGNFEYYTPGGKQPLSALLFGEITSARGTNLSGMGNHRMPTKGEPIATIDDGSKIKNTIGICCPNNSDPPIARAFKNQIITLLNMVTMQNAGEPKKPASVPYCLDDDTITISCPKKFGKPKGARPPPATMVAKVDVDTGDAVDDGEHLPSLTSTSESVELPPSETIDVRKNELYDARYLPDYDDAIFNLKVDKLVQHDFLDIESRLIPCWKLEESLPPGTLCLFRVSIECYNIPRGNDTFRYHQLNCHQIRVIDHRLPSIMDHANSTAAGQRHGNHLDHAVEDFDSFTTARRISGREQNAEFHHLSPIEERPLSENMGSGSLLQNQSAGESSSVSVANVIGPEVPSNTAASATKNKNGKRNRKAEDKDGHSANMDTA